MQLESWGKMFTWWSFFYLDMKQWNWNNRFFLQKCGPGTGQLSTIFPCLGAARRAADSVLSKAFSNCSNKTAVLDPELVCGGRSGHLTKNTTDLSSSAVATGYSTTSTLANFIMESSPPETYAAGVLDYSVSLSLTLQSISLADFNTTRQKQLRQVNFYV